MGEPTKRRFEIPPEQQAIQDRCFHPSRKFTAFPIEEVEQSIPERFEKIARLYPGQIAVKMGDRAMTYDELNQGANRIAYAVLEKRGSMAEPIMLFFEHGSDVITAILGVLKAGKFYVSVDVSFPAQRINQIVGDCRTGLILTNDRHADLARRLSDRGCEVINIDLLDTSVTCDNPTIHLSPGSLASILYTSGSTGKPKGIAHSHRSQLHTVMVNTNETRICYQDKLTLIHSVGFGSAQAHVFQSLLNGGSLFSFDLKSHGIHRLAKWLSEESITVYHSPPAVFRQLAEVIAVEEQLSYLRLIRLSGAAVTRLDYDLYKRTFVPSALLQVVMNSTEANVICSFLTDGSYAFPDRGAPAGYPVTGKAISLLDEDGCEVAPGEAGEIAVQSAYFPVGSWDDRDLMGIQMGADPMSRSERTILTGDIGRILPDGLVIHLGRKDSMVKIRGYRVDLSEIEQVLQGHPEIKDSCVVAWDFEPGEKTIVGYVVPRNQPFPPVDELNAYLRAELPAYMIPTAYVFLDVLPLINGKLDRAGLPKPEGKRPVNSQPYVSPQSEIEKELVRIWEEVLDVRPIGIYDNFFDLGGHSLAATRIISRAVEKFQLELPLQSLFQSPTVNEMAKVFQKYEGKKATEMDLERILGEIEAMSEHEAQQLVAKYIKSKRSD